MRLLTLLVFAGALAACTVKSDPNQGRYSCAVTADCGDGFECRPQVTGAGRCFKVGECKDVDECDGADEDCNGAIDDKFSENGKACMTGQAGVCAAGTWTCVVGTLTCMRTTAPSTELCNGLDDNCNGMTDEVFDFTSDEQNCGQCGRQCGSGTSCLASRCLETTCDDTVDNDNNGFTDCADLSCFAQPCVTPMPPTRRCGAVVPLPDGGLDGGTTDAGLDDAGTSDGGADGGDAGLVRGCFAPEADCANGYDDDGDGQADCLDADCDGQLCPSGTRCAMRMCPGPG